MTKFGTLAAAAALGISLGGQAYAGGMAEPIVEAETIVEDAAVAGSGAGILLPLLLLLIVGAAASGGLGTS
ncbi:MAG: hypothetical protein RLZZ528_2956 [Pseudomonadota bacterium]|jgi:hypothetical protein